MVLQKSHFYWIFLLTLGLSGCGVAPTPLPPSATPEPTAVSVDQLRFNDEQTGIRFRALDACIAKLTEWEGWRSSGYRLVGNFHEAAWCKGAGAPNDCQTSSANAGRRDQHVIDLSTSFFPQRYPQVFGLSLSARWVPEGQNEWSVSFYFSEDADGILGEGAGINFQRYVPNQSEPIEQISVLGGLNYLLSETRLSVTDPNPILIRENLNRVLASPEALRDSGLDLYSRLGAEVDDAIRTNRLVACDRDEYQGNGIQPICTPRALNQQERESEQARASTYFATSKHLLEEHYQEFYDLLFKAFPLDRCWQ